MEYLIMMIILRVRKFMDKFFFFKMIIRVDLEMKIHLPRLISQNNAVLYITIGGVDNH
jgi:hypothetical protein